MMLPFAPPLEPMLAKASSSLPEGDGWLFEPKWDGFRALVFRDGDEVYTQSRDLKPLDRYFPELEAPFLAQLPERCVLDGEVVIAREGRLDFEALLLRIHPAASRVRMLAAESPASFVAWDLLAIGDEDLRGVPQGERRARLEVVLGSAVPPVHLTPATLDRALAADWFDRFEGAGLDGVVAKRLDGVYQPGKRAMLKVKHQRTADCVVAGFRWHKNGPGTHVGSLLLGLFDDDGTLHHVGVTSSFTGEKRESLVIRSIKSTAICINQFGTGLWRIQSTSSHIFSMRPRLWVTMTMVFPRLRNSPIFSRHFRVKASSPTARTSSMSRMSGST